nr:MAG TPA: hypothetical protein [Bacteriophage sp.]
MSPTKLAISIAKITKIHFKTQTLLRDRLKNKQLNIFFENLFI